EEACEPLSVEDLRLLKASFARFDGSLKGGLSLGGGFEAREKPFYFFYGFEEGLTILGESFFHACFRNVDVGRTGAAVGKGLLNEPEEARDEFFNGLFSTKL